MIGFAVSSYHQECFFGFYYDFAHHAFVTDKCTNAEDGLEQLVSACSPSFTSRYGEICWAQGGTGYGWWPSCIYDPRLTMGSTRLQARRNLGKKHLVYFLQCNETPFDLLPESKIMKWEEGMAENFYHGRSAKNGGRNRFMRFQEALQAAVLEEMKPLTRRLEWGGNDAQTGPNLLPSPTQLAASAKKKERRAANVVRRKIRKQAKRSIDFGDDQDQPMSRAEPSTSRPKSSLRSSITNAPPPGAPPAGSGTARKGDSDASSESSTVYCQVFLTDDQSSPGKLVGFVELSSQMGTFADAREAINDSLETEKFPSEWRFLHPSLGPVSIKLEQKIGSMIKYLRKGPLGSSIGEGTVERPFKVTIVGNPLSLGNPLSPGTI